jgi:hypothetical protein
MEELRKMKIEIKHRFTGNIVISGEYESIMRCLEQNRGADLWDADLAGADLWDADLAGADLRGADLAGADLRDVDLRGADLAGANLRDVDLRGADLAGANLRDVDLRGADLAGAKNYQDSHDVFIESVRRQKVDVFTEAEWGAIAQITIHRLCWDSIKKRFSSVVPHIFKILADAGFNEWLKYWEEIK